MTIGNAISLIKLAIPIGLLLGLLWFKHLYHHEAAARLAERAATVQATQLATQAQIALNEAQASKYKEAADHADERHQTALAAADDAAARYITAHRLHNGSSAAGGSDTVPAAGAATVPAIATASPVLVAVESGDVMTCTADYQYAASAYAWAQGLIKDGLAK